MELATATKLTRKLYRYSVFVAAQGPVVIVPWREKNVQVGGHPGLLCEIRNDDGSAEENGRIACLFVYNSTSQPSVYSNAGWQQGPTSRECSGSHCFAPQPLRNQNKY